MTPTEQPNKQPPITLHLCLPNYGGMLFAPFVRSLLNCQQNGKARFTEISFIDGDSLISRARNVCADQFLASPNSHLMFIDCDIEFSVEDIDKILGHLSRGVDVVAGMYPKKQDKLEWVLNSLDGCKELTPDEHGLAEIKYAGTGFLAVSRRVFNTLIAGECSDMWYHTDTGQHERRKVQYDFFQVGHHVEDDGSRRYLSEDWFFTELCRQAGYKVMCDLTIKTAHIGKKVYKEGM